MLCDAMQSLPPHTILLAICLKFEQPMRPRVETERSQMWRAAVPIQSESSLRLGLAMIRPAAYAFEALDWKVWAGGLWNEAASWRKGGWGGTSQSHVFQALSLWDRTVILAFFTVRD